MSSELKGPIHTQIKQYILDKSIVEFKLTNNEIIAGRIIWLDEKAMFLETADNNRITVLFSSILYFFKKN